MNAKGFEVGDKVTWTSHGGGKGMATAKTGEIEGIIKSGISAATMLKDGAIKVAFQPRFDGGPRHCKSYLVSVPNGNRKPLLYWPRASQLSLVEDK